MMQHPSYEELNDWIDELLEADDAQRIATHCATCFECSRTVHGLRSLLADSRALPRAIEPPADAWTSIAANTTKRSTRRQALWQLRYPLAAAAVLVIALTSVLTFFVTRQQPTRAAGMQGQPNAAVQLAMRRAEADYAETLHTLESLLAARREQLDPKTVKLLDEHLALIDRAIKDATEALARNPDNQALPHIITGAYERKVNMLTRALRPARDI